MPDSTGSKSRILRLIFTAELVSRFAFPARAMYPPMAAELLSFLLSCTEITLKKCESKNTMRIITYKHRELQLVLLSFLLPHSPKHVLHVLPQILVSPGPTPVDTQLPASRNLTVKLHPLIEMRMGFVVTNYSFSFEISY